MRRTLSALATTLACAVAACADPAAPALAPPDPPSVGTPTPPSAAEVFARFVALGTSNSMGVQSAGISAAAQGAS
jgi:hypothetical protein